MFYSLPSAVCARFLARFSMRLDAMLAHALTNFAPKFFSMGKNGAINFTIFLVVFRIAAVEQLHSESWFFFLFLRTNSNWQHSSSSILWLTALFLQSVIAARSPNPINGDGEPKAVEDMVKVSRGVG